MIARIFAASLFIISAIAALSLPRSVHAFCGFYVGKADATLFNEASQVIVVRNEDKTVISMQNDYRGELKEFAIVVPVPQVLQRGQINVGDRKIFDRIDAYSAPRLAEYHDGDPCARRKMMEMARAGSLRALNAPSAAGARQGAGRHRRGPVHDRRVRHRDSFGKESDGLETWLQQSGYKIPRGASAALKPYIRQNMKFFVAKVNLKEQAKTGFTYLRPLQFAFDSEKFMLPIRLGMVNAQGPQDLIVYMLTKTGRVETTNYRTVKLPANMDIPTYVKGDFARFYKALFNEQAKKEEYRVAFTEYFWDMSWCDPCAADPLSPQELKAAGVFWLDTDDAPPIAGPGIAPGSPPGIMRPRPIAPGAAAPVMLTRLHVRYSPQTFPEDLMFQETKDRQNFQTRYVLHQPWTGDINACEEARAYFSQLPARFEREAQTLASLTGWEIGEIRKNMDVAPLPPPQKPWWQNLWSDPRSLPEVFTREGLNMPNELAQAPGAAAQPLSPLLRIRARLPRDARIYQIAFQATLLTLGVVARDFSLRPEQMLLCFAAGLGAQACWVNALRLQNVGWLSPIITCLGLSLLLRADSLWVHPLAAALAMSAKFTLRVAGKHLFNPANLGVIVALIALPGAWVSPGQWGNDLAYALWFVALGGLVTQRARRWDVSWAFLAAWLGLIALRVVWLGQPQAIWWHQLQSGGLLLFAFFMISDPMTIPNRQCARILYAIAVAGLAFVWQFVWFKPNALLWSLFLCAWLVPVFDRIWPAAKATWSAAEPLPERKM